MDPYGRCPRVTRTGVRIHRHAAGLVRCRNRVGVAAAQDLLSGRTCVGQRVGLARIERRCRRAGDRRGNLGVGGSSRSHRPQRRQPGPEAQVARRDPRDRSSQRVRQALSAQWGLRARSLRQHRAGPWGPAAPGTPIGPGGPAAPAAPIGPCGPPGPCDPPGPDGPGDPCAPRVPVSPRSPAAP